MPSAFISYRRTDSAALATLIAVRLKEVHGIDAYVDTRNTDGGGPFPDRLRGAIERSDVFVCLLGATTLDSNWVQIEIEHAHNLRKTMIPVFQERYIPPSPIPNEHVEALLQSDGVQFLDVRNLYIDQAIAQLAEMIQKSAPRPIPVPPTPPPTPIYRRFPVILTVLALIIAILALIILSTLNQPRSTSTLTNVALNQTDTSAPTLTPSPTLEIAFIVQTLDSEATIEQATLDVQSTAAARATAYAVGTQSLLDQTAIATHWTSTPTPNITASIEAYRTQQAATVTIVYIQTQQAISATAAYIAGLTATATLWTAAPTLTFTPSPTLAPIPLGFPGNPVTQNTNWTPQYQTFDGVEMALVPVGCFMMGSDNGSDDEKPVNQQCFDQPFWIDRYEVTNKQYGSEGNFKGDSHPRDSVTWFQACDFCAQRGARLPTEREWEYAARGPSNLVYPWGNDFVADNVVYSNNSNNQTADVGSRPAGNSWVGASDLSGNVLEWVSTIYGIDKNGNYDFSESGDKLFPYPYDAADGREQNSEDRTFVRVLRGGSWVSYESDLRASDRLRSSPSDEGYSFGFRCVRLS